MTDPARRREALAKAISAVTARLADRRSELRAAPNWFQPDLDLSRLPQDRVSAAKKYQTLVVDAAQDTELLDVLRLDANRLDLGRIDHARCLQRTIKWLNEVGSVRELLEQLVSDPAGPFLRRSLRPPPQERDDQANAKAVLVLRERLGGRFRTGSDLDPIAELDQSFYDDLVHTGCTLVPEPPQPPFRPDIDVLVPVRIETRFDPPERGLPWRLRVRIVPDDISINRHDPKPSEGEVDTLAKLWSRSAGDLTTEEGRAAWHRFVDSNGGRRAAWLAKTFPALADGSPWEPPTDIRQDPLISSVAGWPPEIELWMARGGAPAVRAATLAVDRDQLLFDFPSPEDTDRRRWWNSFERAAEVGLATTIDLGVEAPKDIDVLYVVGRGGPDPTMLFQAHEQAGTLSILPPGTPTNTSDLSPTDELPNNPDFWLAQAAGSPVASALEREVGRALVGQPNALTALPGSDRDDSPVGRALVSALWTVLWQQSLAHVWGASSDAMLRTGLWAGTHLSPEGPLPAIRVGSQPYGLLPTSSLRRWKPAVGDPDIEAAMIGPLTQLRASAAQAAMDRGTVVNADSEQFLSIVGQPPASPAYASRWFFPLDLWMALLAAFGVSIPVADQEAWWDELHRDPLDLGLQPNRRYLAVGSAHDLALPLVEPEKLPEGTDLAGLLRMLADLPPGVLIHRDGIDQVMVHGKLPASLLVRLIARSIALTAAEVERIRLNDPTPLIEAISTPITDPGRIGSLVLQFSPGHLSGDPASLLFVKARQAVADLADAVAEPEVVERVLRSTLDTAMYRVDPWITGVVTRRLNDLSAQNPQRRLGIYGWVDRPAPGSPGPVPETLLVAPDHSQAYTAAVLRDRDLNDHQSDRWTMNIDSTSVQEATRIAAEIRVGSHLSEALGRRVERFVADPAAIDALRVSFPIRVEHEGRRTCDGEAVIKALAEDPGSIPSSVLAAARARITELGAVVDTYADLLVAEAVYNVVEGRGDVAGAAMEAAAGFASPPSLDVIRTPRSGRAVNSNLLVAIAAAPPVKSTDVDFRSSPLQIADPSIAAWLEASLGTAETPPWRWPLIDDTTDPDAPATSEVSLAELDLTPIDTLTLAPELLGDLAAAVEGPAFRVDRSGPVPAEETARTATRMLEALGRRPATPAELADEAVEPPATPVFEELLDRYRVLRTAAETLPPALSTAAASTDPIRKQEALRAGHRWGITPIPEAGDIDEQLAAVVTTVQQRLAAAPPIGDPSVDGAAESLGLDELAQAVTTLASPEAKMPLLATIALEDLPLTLDPVPADVYGNPMLDREWLDVVSAVREPAAALAAFQLEAAFDPNRSPWQAWTNQPGDPWQTAVDPDPPSDAIPNTTRLVAVYGPSGLLDQDPTTRIAVGIVDQWAELIPTDDHTISAAFGFDAPAARAPQAVLLAVPPMVDQDLTTDALIEILAETRELARARVVRQSDLATAGATAPTTLFQTRGIATVDLDP